MRTRFLALILVVAAGHVRANELSLELRGLIESFSAHRRAAIGYLRTENFDLGAIEIERLHDQWMRDRRRLTPDVAKDRSLSKALADTEAAIGGSFDAVQKGDLARAQTLLQQAAMPLKDWRRAKGIRLFSDCVGEAGAAYEQLDVHRVRAPNLASVTTGEGIVSAAAGVADAFKRCDSEAPQKIRDDPEFRRLIEGMIFSLNQMPNAVQRKDGGALHRLLIEQRAFERLLAFRFG
jgi:hypothetical protein